MKNAADVVQALEKTNSRLDKERLLRDAWQAGIKEFFQGAQWCCNSLTTFGVKKVPLLADADAPGFRASFSWQDFQELVGKLASRELTGHAARDAISQAADGSSQHMWNGFYRRVLLKDLRCGVTETTINKVLKAQGVLAQPYIIPVFSCQLAEDGVDHEHRITGVRMLDHKLDGCLSSTWTVEFDDGRKISIQDVVDKNLQGRIKSFNIITGMIEYNRIVGWSKNTMDINPEPVKWFRLHLSNGVVLPPLTGNHLIWLPALQCWRRVDLLKINDELLYTESPSSF